MRLKFFLDIFAPPNSSATRTVCIKNLGKISRRLWAIVQVKYNGYEKLAFLTNISLSFENGTRYDHSYNGRRIGNRM